MLVSLGSFFYYLRRGDILMHGDATAHINIARRVIDSLTPGPLQLGTVWLPLPHLLMLPFLFSDALWQSGAAGSFPSMIAYVLGVLGIFRLVRTLFAPACAPQVASLGAWISALVYAANPNLIYMQTTALTETLYLGFYVWAMVFFIVFVRTLGKASELEAADDAFAQRRALWNCSLSVACAEWTRYDGWFLAGVIGLMVLFIATRRWHDTRLRRQAIIFLAVIAAPAVVWLAYNAVIYGSALAFATGPYSAHAIEQLVAAPYPGLHHPWVAALYFLKSAQITLAVGNWGRFWVAAAVAATAIALHRIRRPAVIAAGILLWTPLAFHTLSIAYGSVFVHVPMWWPFAIFNQRFGLELLPLFAVSVGVLVAITAASIRHGWVLAVVAILSIAASYAFVWKAAPLCSQEASHNWEIRRAMDTAVARAVGGLPAGSRFLMDLGEHVGVMERLGIPLRRVVNTENHRPWKRPSDPDGVWERALADPRQYVDYVVAFEGDAVDRKVNRRNLSLLTEIHALGRPPARIYSTRP
jgi:hypothetical protein